MRNAAEFFSDILARDKANIARDGHSIFDFVKEMPAAEVAALTPAQGATVISEALSSWADATPGMAPSRNRFDGDAALQADMGAMLVAHAIKAEAAFAAWDA